MIFIEKRVNRISLLMLHSASAAYLFPSMCYALGIKKEENDDLFIYLLIYLLFETQAIHLEVAGHFSQGLTDSIRSFVSSSYPNLII